jgi:hypothetical protein
MAERTPPMSAIRHAWAKAHPFPLTTDVDERYAEFDRALAAHDAEVRAGVVTEEPEWEYGVRRRNGVDEYGSEHWARWHVGRHGQDGERQWVVRRRPGTAPGEWERAPSEREPRVATETLGVSVHNHEQREGEDDG